MQIVLNCEELFLNVTNVRCDVERISNAGYERVVFIGKIEIGSDLQRVPVSQQNGPNVVVCHCLSALAPPFCERFYFLRLQLKPIAAALHSIYVCNGLPHGGSPLRYQWPARSSSSVRNHPADQAGASPRSGHRSSRPAAASSSAFSSHQRGAPMPPGSTPAELMAMTKSSLG